MSFLQADPVAEFKTLGRKDAFERMLTELNKLWSTTSEEKKEVLFVVPGSLCFLCLVGRWRTSV